MTATVEQTHTYRMLSAVSLSNSRPSMVVKPMLLSDLQYHTQSISTLRGTTQAAVSAYSAWSCVRLSKMPVGSVAALMSLSSRLVRLLNRSNMPAVNTIGLLPKRLCTAKRVVNAHVWQERSTVYHTAWWCLSQHMLVWLSVTAKSSPTGCW